MSNITAFPASTTFTPGQALDSAKSHDLKDVLVIGYDQDGELIIRSSRLTRRDARWMGESARQHIFTAEG